MQKTKHTKGELNVNATVCSVFFFKEVLSIDERDNKSLSKSNSRPIVVQQRNPHSYDADFMAELPLYVQTKALTAHIIQNYINNSTQNFLHNFQKSIELLWIDLFERGFVEAEDVRLVKLWIKALTQVGYQFQGNSKSKSETAGVSSQHLRLLNGGKTLNQLSVELTNKLYHKSSYINSTCLQNSAGLS